MGEKPFRLPESARKALLRDNGYSDSSDPDAYMRREEPISPKKLTLVTTGQTFVSETARMDEAILATIDIDHE